MKFFDKFIKKKYCIALFLTAIFIIPISNVKAFSYVDLSRTVNFNEYDNVATTPVENICSALDDYFKNSSYNYMILAKTGSGSGESANQAPFIGCQLFIYPSNNINLNWSQSSNYFLFRQQNTSYSYDYFNSISQVNTFINWVSSNGRLPNDSFESGIYINRTTQSSNSILMWLYWNTSTGIGTWGNRYMIFNTNVNFNVVKQSSVTYSTSYDNGTTFLQNNQTYPVYRVLNPGLPTEEEYIGIESQVFSIDNVIQDELPHDIEFSFYLKQDRNWIIDSFDTYRLYENNGLYHYEKATTTDKMCTMTDYVESVNADNKWTIKLIDLTCNKSDGAIGFYYKINITNVFDYARLELKEKMPIHYINNFSWNRIIKTFNTSQFKYINFSSNLDNYTDTWYMYSNEFEGRIGHEMYFTYFNLDSLKFFDYLDEGAESSPAVYNPLIGQEIKRGLTLNRKNTDILNGDYNHFNFDLVFNPNNLYFSITENDGTAYNDGAIIVDDLGNPIESNIELEDGVVGEIIDYTNLLKYINNFMRDSSVYINEFFGLFNYGFNKIDIHIRNFIIALFSMLVITVIVIRLRR